MEFRDLHADEIECRVSTVTEKGVSLLLYKDARCDMNILDETVGAENWQNKFYEQKGILFCSLGINTNYHNPTLPDRWIWKDDAGTESNTEAEKGNASDARKRSGFAFGLGRELYTAPFIWIKAGDCKVFPNAKTRSGFDCRDRFTVTDVEIQNKKIVKLEIRNDSTGQRAFIWGNAQATINKPELINDLYKFTLKNLISETNTDVAKILGYYEVKQIEDMTMDQGLDAIRMLEAKKEKVKK